MKAPIRNNTQNATRHNKSRTALLIAALITLITLITLPYLPAKENLPSGPQEIFINLKTQTLTATENGEKIFQFPCSTGKNNGTPPGTWPIKEKVRYNRSLPQYGSVPIPFSLRLKIHHKGRSPRIAIHAHKHVPNYPASHGCIRLSYQNAEKLFHWAQVGTQVHIHTQ